MRAAVQSGYGPPALLRIADVPEPSCPPGRLRIRVHAASINPIDWKMLSGKLRFVRPVKFPAIPLFDAAGKVETAAGSDFSVGERVCVRLNNGYGGGAAELVTTRPELVARIPAALSWEQAAGLPLAGMTALQALRDDGRVKAGHRVLIVGASGGVGHFALQVARILGARVTGVCSTANVPLVRDLGADDVIDYRTQNGYGSGPYDTIFDCVGRTPFSRFAGVLARGGTYVTINPEGTFGRIVLSKLGIGPRVVFRLLRSNRSDLEWLCARAQEGTLRVVIDRVVPLTDIAAAFQRSRSGRTVGKVVIAVRGSEDRWSCF